MSTRTNITEVRAVMDTALEDEELKPIIEMANRIVTLKLSASTLTAAELKDIETYLTAHLIATGKERQPEEEKVGDVDLRFQKKPQEFLKSTTYGQTVLFLDTSGLMQQSTKMRASITAIKQIQE